MIWAFDIETIGNTDMVALLPEPKIDSRLKDPAKITAAMEDAKKKQVDLMALDALTARVCCVSFVGEKMVDGEMTVQDMTSIISTVSDDTERELIRSVIKVLADPETRLVTWNGIGFDLPMIYKRAMILKVDLSEFAAPPLSAWTKRYSNDRHFDLMQIWGGWSSRDYAKLDTVASMVLGDKKNEIDVTAIAGMLSTNEGREKVAEYCKQDTALTWRLWERFNGFLFA